MAVSQTFIPDPSQEFVDNVDGTTPLSQLEQARATAGGQNFRAPGFIGNFDRTITDNVTPTDLGAPPAPTTSLGTVGTSDGGFTGATNSSGPNVNGPTPGGTTDTTGAPNASAAPSVDANAPSIGRANSTVDAIQGIANSPVTAGVVGALAGPVGTAALGIGRAGLDAINGPQVGAMNTVASKVSMTPTQENALVNTPAVNNDVSASMSSPTEAGHTSTSTDPTAAAAAAAPESNTAGVTTSKNGVDVTGASTSPGTDTGNAGSTDGAPGPGEGTGGGSNSPGNGPGPGGGQGGTGDGGNDGAAGAGTGGGSNGPGNGPGPGGGQGGAGDGGSDGNGGGGNGGGGGDGGNGGGGGDGGACFVGRTLILMGDGSKKPISDVRPGEIVAAFDGLGPLEPCRVTAKIEHDPRAIFVVAGLHVTAEHPILTSRGTYERAVRLEAGDSLINADGDLVSLTQDPFKTGEISPVFNLEVDRLHTYVAGGLRVHNKFAMGGVVGGRRAIGPARQVSPRFHQRRSGQVIAERGEVVSSADGPPHDATGQEELSRRMVGPMRRATSVEDPTQGAAPGQYAAMGGAVLPRVGPQRGRPTVARQRMQQGGQISGPGTENSDSVPIAASRGEFVVPAEVVKYYGAPFFNGLINTADEKTGMPRGADANGNPPSPAAQESFQRTQGGDPDNSDTQQPEASNPRQIPQGTPLMAAGPTMAPVMAKGGMVPNVAQMKDDDLVQHARMSRARGDRAGHQAASQEIARRLRGGQSNAPDAAVNLNGQPDPDAPYAMGGMIRPQSVGPMNTAGSRISGSAGGGVRVPPVRAVGGIGAQPQIPIAAPGPRLQGMPTPPAVIGAGPPMQVAPPQPMPRSAPAPIASPSASGIPRTPRTSLGGIGVRR